MDPKGASYDETISKLSRRSSLYTDVLFAVQWMSESPADDSSSHACISYPWKHNLGKTFHRNCSKIRIFVYGHKKAPPFFFYTLFLGSVPQCKLEPLLSPCYIDFFAVFHQSLFFDLLSTICDWRDETAHGAAVADAVVQAPQLMLLLLYFL